LAYVVGIFGEDASGLDRGAELERLAALGQLAGGDVEGEEMRFGVDGDMVAVLHEGERAADVGFG
jgi:hypothetical protein